MFSEFVSLFLLFLYFPTAHAIQWSGSSFTYNGFKNSATDLIQGGLATVTANGLLRLTDLTQRQQGHAFYANPLVFKNSSDGETFSFSTTFVLAIFPRHSDIGGQGMAFVIAPSTTLQGSQPSQYLGLLNKTNNGNSSNHILAVEFDTFINTEFSDINENHIGIDINSLRSNVSSPVKYNLNGVDKNLSLISGDRLQVWVDYNGLDKQLSVTIAPISTPKPKLPLLLLNLDISFVLLDSMYVGFSAATGTSMQSSHYILGWSFSIDGEAQPLDLSRLPKLPRLGPKGVSKIVTIVLPLILPVLAVVIIASLFLFIRRMKMYEEVYEDWERKYGPHRFLYKDLYVATRGFREKELLGMGGFGSVYKGVLPTSKMEVAVKRISHESKQGIKEFVAEIVSIGQLRHRNIVQLLGYCRRKHELFLVYDYMPNGSLDKYLHCGSTSLRLDWKQRFQIIKGVASGLVYLHEEWDQVVIHRDIKASNVLLDADFNGRLGDFGLARLYDHGTNPQTTHVVGTLGYIAPEMTRSGKATTSTDVYGFGAFLLEVACGRRPIEPLAADGNIILSDWVVACLSRGEILEVSDPNLGSGYVKEEMELVLKLGLLCSQTKTTARPSMRQVLQFLDKDLALPDISLHGLTVESIGFGDGGGFSDFAVSYPSLEMATTTFTSVADTVLSP